MFAYAKSPGTGFVMADIEGDSGDNTINGTTGNDTIKGLGGNDTLNGSSGDDAVSGGAGNDSIDGGSSNDTVYGGAGDDTITGGAGDDIIIGGRGDDVMSAGNGSTTDTFVIRDGDGNDTITDFDPFEPDIVRFDMAEMSTYQDVLDRISLDGPDTIITYDNGSTLRLQNVDSANLSATNFQFGPGPVCLEAGTIVQTPDGPRPIETICVGELVDTMDHGPQKVVRVISEFIKFTDQTDKHRPILVSKGSITKSVPAKDIVCSPQHRFLVGCPNTQQDVLVAAIKLVSRKGIRRMMGRKSAHYINLLMERHEIIIANGCPVESLLMTPYLAMKFSAERGFELNSCSKMRPARSIVFQDPILGSKVQATKRQLAPLTI